MISSWGKWISTRTVSSLKINGWLTGNLSESPDMTFKKSWRNSTKSKKVKYHLTSQKLNLTNPINPESPFSIISWLTWKMTKLFFLFFKTLHKIEYEIKSDRGEQFKRNLNYQNQQYKHIFLFYHFIFKISSKDLELEINLALLNKIDKESKVLIGFLLIFGSSSSSLFSVILFQFFLNFFHFYLLFLLFLLYFPQNLLFSLWQNLLWTAPIFIPIKFSVLLFTIFLIIEWYFIITSIICFVWFYFRNEHVQRFLLNSADDSCPFLEFWVQVN